MKRLIAVVIPFMLLGAVSCGRDAPSIELAPLPLSQPPPWPDLAKVQIEEAQRLGVPVKFENHLKMRFVLIPAGSFIMGSPAGEEFREDHETQHQVTLTRAFYLQTTEVTNAQFRRWKPDHVAYPFNDQPIHSDAQPVVHVSWKGATAFAAWLSDQDQERTYRLPTEAEWEYACRAGTTTTYAWGDDISEGWRYANGNDPESNELFGDRRPAWPRDDGYWVSAPVGSYPPNPWGLHDMHGNVEEWCEDWVSAYAADAVTDPKGPENPVNEDERRVIRGGSWHWRPGRLRSASRGGMPPEWDIQPDEGFRLVCPLPARVE
jgi:formylglycine-generating enzyme required for sulfatase activity